MAVIGVPSSPCAGSRRRADTALGSHCTCCRVADPTARPKTARPRPASTAAVVGTTDPDTVPPSNVKRTLLYVKHVCHAEDAAAPASPADEGQGQAGTPTRGASAGHAVCRPPSRCPCRATSPGGATLRDAAPPPSWAPDAVRQDRKSVVQGKRVEIED